MIKRSELNNALATLSFNATEYNIETFNEDTEIPLPYATYLISNGNAVSADGTNYFGTLTVRLVLVDEEYDINIIHELETALINNEIFYEKSYDFDEDERLYSVVYEFEVIDG